MREKDQESRISQLKVNELKRMLRYSKLKPLKIEDPIDKLTNRRRSIKAQGRSSNKNLSWSVIHSKKKTTATPSDDEYAGDMFEQDHTPVEDSWTHRRSKKANKNDKLPFTNQDHQKSNLAHTKSLKSGSSQMFGSDKKVPKDDRSKSNMNDREQPYINDVNAPRGKTRTYRTEANI